MKLSAVAILLGALIVPNSASAQPRDHWISVSNDGEPMIIGSGRVVSQPRGVAGFRSIETNGAEDIHVRLGERPSLVVTADDNLLPYVRTDVRDGVLHVRTVGSFRTRRAPQIYVTVPDLASAVTRGSGDIDIAGVNSRQLELISQGSGDVRAEGRTGRLIAKLQGSGDAELRALQAASADVNVSGSGDAWIGSIADLTARSYGSGDVHVVGQTRSADVGVYGSGDAWVATSGTLVARTYGSGDVHVSGHPASLSVSQGGSGRVIIPRG